MNDFEINGIKYKKGSSNNDIHVIDSTINSLEGFNWNEIAEKFGRNISIKLIIFFKNCQIESLFGIQCVTGAIELRFHDCKINNTLDIEKCENLFFIKFFNCTFPNNPSFVINNSNIKFLSIYHSKGFTTMKFLGKLPKLRSLKIQHTTLEEINNPEKITTLTSLSLENNKIYKLDGIVEIVRQNPQLKFIYLLGNPIKETKDIEGILKWEVSGKKLVPRTQISSLRLSIPSVDTHPKPKPIPIHETYIISDRATSCTYCNNTIPPLMDYYLKHNKKYDHLRTAFSLKNLDMKEKRVLYTQDIGHYRRETYQYFRIESFKIFYPQAKGPMCEKCSGKFLKEMERILPKLKTKGTKMALRKSVNSVQKKLDIMRKKWGSEYLGFGSR